MVVVMVRKQRGQAKQQTARLEVKAPCSVCGQRDARALVDVVLASGAPTVLCGSHELMHRRVAPSVRTVEELRTALADRRSTDRRGHGTEEVDELAAALAAAFTNERRGKERRAI